MLKSKLLVLQKKLTLLLNKSFIKVSNLLAALLVLFAKKLKKRL